MAEGIKVGATVKVRLFGQGRVVTENGTLVDLDFVDTKREPPYFWEPQDLKVRTMYVVEYVKPNGEIGRGIFYTNEVEETKA